MADVEASMVAAQTDRIMQRRISGTGVLIDIFVFVYLVVLATYIGISHVLLFWPLTDAYTWDFFRLYLPGLICLFLPMMLYWQVFYGYLLLIVLFLITDLAFTGFILVCLIWLMVDWGNCSGTLWCIDIDYYSVDPVTGAKIFGPTLSSNPRVYFLLFFFAQCVLIALNVVFGLLALYIFNVYNTWLKARNAQNMTRDESLYLTSMTGIDSAYFNGKSKKSWK
jgi:hypothetical protein